MKEIFWVQLSLASTRENKVKYIDLFNDYLSPLTCSLNILIQNVFWMGQ
jgi:hypothetical protein